MANQYVNKVAVNGKTVLDLSGDTVYPGMLAKGITAHDKSGAKITGTLDVPDTEERTVELSMPSGDQVIQPTSGKVMRKVTVQKPATLLPGNIKKDVVIGGVTGTLDVASSGGGTCKLKINVTAAGKGWTMVICPQSATDTEILLSSTHKSAEISLPNNGLFVFCLTGGFTINSININNWGRFDFLSMSSEQYSLDKRVYVCYAGDTGDGTWDIRIG